MKKHFSIIAVLLGCILFSSCEKKEAYTVTGRLISYIEGEVLHPTMTYLPSGKNNNTLVENDDLFQFHGKISAEGQEIAYVEMNDVHQWIVFLEPGNVILDENSRCAIGTPLNDAHKKCESRINRITLKQSSTMMDDLKEEYRNIISEHNNDILGAFYLSQVFSIFKKDEFEEIMKNAGPGLKDNKFFKNLYPDIKARVEEITYSNPELITE